MCCAMGHGGHTHAHEARKYPYEQGDWCLCPGTEGWHEGAPITLENVAEIGACCGARSGDDNLCDRCREHCKEGGADAVA